MFNKKTLLDRFAPPRWWGWARQHPGALLVGAMLLAALVVPHSRAKSQPAADLDADETPLFI